MREVSTALAHEDEPAKGKAREELSMENGTPVKAPVRSSNGTGMTKSEREKVKVLAVKMRDCLLIDPRTNRWMPVWDIVMLVALIFTATVTVTRDA